MKINIKLLTPEAKIPTYATDGSGCFDFYSCVDDVLALEDAIEIPTGISMEIPEGYVLEIYSRSGHGFKEGVRLANCVGIIDSDYRGEIRVKLHKDAGIRTHIRKGDRIAQGKLVEAKRVVFNVVEKLSDTDRGEGGFGSTGVT